ncbi:MAG TPA: SPOR domain-containing protein [Edaphobacter sp.]
MKTRYLEDDDIDEIPRDREISLGAPTILGIFFLIALICAVFFGFGYSFGRKSSSAAIAAAPSSDSVEASSIKASGAAKPSAAETPDDTPEPTDTSATTASANVPTEQPAVVVETPAKHTATLKPAPAKPAAVVEKPVAPSPTPVAHGATAGSVAPSVPSIVQIAAVSHQEDADVMLNALKRRGYNVAVHHEPQDKLLHIQIGPLASRKDADAMRQRLLADGYKAIIK